jgi:hypothetical protein
MDALASDRRWLRTVHRYQASSLSLWEHFFCTHDTANHELVSRTLSGKLATTISLDVVLTRPNAAQNIRYRLLTKRPKPPAEWAGCEILPASCKTVDVFGKKNTCAPLSTLNNQMWYSPKKPWRNLNIPSTFPTLPVFWPLPKYNSQILDSLECV